MAVSALQSMSVCAQVKAGGEQRPCYQIEESRNLFFSTGDMSEATELPF